MYRYPPIWLGFGTYPLSSFSQTHSLFFIPSSFILYAKYSKVTKRRPLSLTIFPPKLSRLPHAILCASCFHRRHIEYLTRRPREDSAGEERRFAVKQRVIGTTTTTITHPTTFTTATTISTTAAAFQHDLAIGCVMKEPEKTHRKAERSQNGEEESISSTKVALG